MKMFNRVLAVILSLVMLLSVVPVAAFAAEPAGGNGGNGGGTASVVAVPGTGKDGTVTLKLDANTLVEALKGEKSLEALVVLLKDAIDRSEADTVTKADLLDLVPVDGVFQVLVDNTDPEALENIMGELLATVDSQALLDYAKKPGAIKQDTLIAALYEANDAEKMEEAAKMFKMAQAMWDFDDSEE